VDCCFICIIKCFEIDISSTTYLFALGIMGFYKGHALKTFLTSIFMMALWLMLSGIYKPMLIGFGIVSVALVMVIVRRMDQVDGDHVRISIKPIQFFFYLFWLFIEIAKSNWRVTKIILARAMPIRQNLFEVPYTQTSDLGQVIFANSITLTPGTLTIETETGDFLVHALSYEPADMDALADMDRRVTEIENGVTI
jgi:multicomponent Na+:H+ antiporter subunit E